MYLIAQTFSSKRTSCPASIRVRRGITLPEMMVVLVMLGLVVGGLMTVLVRQQRFYTGTSEIIQTKGSARQAIDILSSELRGISPRTRGGAPNEVDIYAMSDASITFRSQFGGSVLCTIDPTRTVVTLPPQTMAAQNSLTSFLSDSTRVRSKARMTTGGGVWRLRATPSLVNARSRRLASPHRRPRLRLASRLR
jgi:prepilin-type N-terminal cleavage/methylation domain-containing protein